MIVGPRIIFDKSFIQSLNGALIDEMTLYFTATSLPTLISEVIADLKLPEQRDGRIGKDIVRDLARKMTEAHGAQPPPLRSLVVGDLLGQPVPMSGLQLPMMVGTPGVYSREGGLMVSQIPQQKMWARWAAGDFTTDDEMTAAAWRAGIGGTNLEVERKRWKPLAEKMGDPKTLPDVVKTIDGVMNDRTLRTQTDLINLAVDVVCGKFADKISAVGAFQRQSKDALLLECAPFAAHVARLYMCFALGLARDLIGTRRTNTIDLQYLFYAPFCRVFVSGDKVHRRLWEAGAVTSEGSFVWGDDFRSDLKQRSDRRAAMTLEQWTEHRHIHGQWPEPIDGSIIHALWEQHCPWWHRGGDTSPNVGKTIDELDPHLRDVIRRLSELGREEDAES
jgi:hypothetical protein